MGCGKDALLTLLIWLLIPEEIDASLMEWSSCTRLEGTLYERGQKTSLRNHRPNVIPAMFEEDAAAMFHS